MHCILLSDTAAGFTLSHKRVLLLGIGRCGRETLRPPFSSALKAFSMLLDSLVLLDATFGAWPDRKSHNSDPADGGAIGTQVRHGAGFYPKCIFSRSKPLSLLTSEEFYLCWR